MSLTPLTLDGSDADGLRLRAAASRGSWRRLVLWIVAPAMALVWWMSRRSRAGRGLWARAEEIDIDRERVLWSCGGLPMTSSSEVALTDIDALELHIGTAERLLPLKIQLRCRGSAERHELTIPFVVADCDRREEALDFCFRLARAIGAARYRVRHENDETLQVELLLGRHQAGSYRTAVGAPDAQAVPLEQDQLPLLSWQRKFRPPAGEHPPFDGSTGLFEIVHRQAGTRLQIRCPVDWLSVVIMLTLFPLALPLTVACYSLGFGLLAGIVFAIVATPFMLFFEAWAVLVVVAKLAMVVGAVLGVWSGSFLWWVAVCHHRHDWGRNSDLDWARGVATLRRGPFGETVPLSTICGVTVRAEQLTKSEPETVSVYLQLPDRDHLLVEHKNRSLRGLAIELARALDVPVRLPDEPA